MGHSRIEFNPHNTHIPRGFIFNLKISNYVLKCYLAMRREKAPQHHPRKPHLIPPMYLASLDLL